MKWYLFFVMYVQSEAYWLWYRITETKQRKQERLTAQEKLREMYAESIKGFDPSKEIKPSANELFDDQIYEVE